MNIVAYKIDLVHRKYKKFGKNLIAKNNYNGFIEKLYSKCVYFVSYIMEYSHVAHDNTTLSIY